MKHNQYPMSNLTTIQQLQQKFEIEDFVQKTIRQINKDLNGLSEEDVVFLNQENPLDEVVNQLIPIIKLLEGQNQLQQFMYQVDVSENRWVSLMNSQDLHGLCIQVVIREAQKVYLREMYSPL